ncbi:hypothetical protein BN871_CL_00400 [Paenibacillus sp. P22]|nr:hypothetical protein BN871_CL_00400 [Paenibacillus sp. P22]
MICRRQKGCCPSSSVEDGAAAFLFGDDRSSRRFAVRAAGAFPQPPLGTRKLAHRELSCDALCKQRNELIQSRNFMAGHDLRIFRLSAPVDPYRCHPDRVRSENVGRKLVSDHDAILRIDSEQFKSMAEYVGIRLAFAVIAADDDLVEVGGQLRHAEQLLLLQIRGSVGQQKQLVLAFEGVQHLEGFLVYDRPLAAFLREALGQLRSKRRIVDPDGREAAGPSILSVAWSELLQLAERFQLPLRKAGPKPFQRIDADLLRERERFIRAVQLSRLPLHFLLQPLRIDARLLLGPFASGLEGFVHAPLIPQERIVQIKKYRFLRHLSLPPEPLCPS